MTTQSFDFNTAGEQKSFDVVPKNAIAPLHLTIRPGGAGEGGWLKRSKNGDSEALDCEFVIIEGQYAKRKFWTLLTLDGESAGHKEAGQISKAKIRAILESARGVRPDDHSEAAQQARRIENFGELDGLRFVGKIGVEPAKNGYAAKNTLLEVITPERKDWRQIEQVAKPAASAQSANTSSAAPAAIGRPTWAH